MITWQKDNTVLYKWDRNSFATINFFLLQRTYSLYIEVLYNFTIEVLYTSKILRSLISSNMVMNFSIEFSQFFLIVIYQLSNMREKIKRAKLVKKRRGNWVSWLGYCNWEKL